MTHLFEDIAKLGYAMGGLVGRLTVKGRLIKDIRVSRPNWSERACVKAADYLASERVKGPQQFVKTIDYLSYLDIQLSHYSGKHPVVQSMPIADELGLKRWEQRWRASRQPLREQISLSALTGDKAA